ncbi:MAG: RMD1 family protein [Deltaproteobacteria bacterium]|nr:RMD1 family protein [Deltaproteobacteria bacterium]
MTVVALDGQVDLAHAAERLGWTEIRRLPYASVYNLEDGGRLYLFRFGAVLLEGLPALDHSILRVLEQAVGRRHLPQTAETYYLATGQPGEGGPRVGWDRVVVPERSPEMVAAVALLLGQSAALERYELAAEALAEEAIAIAAELKEHGRVPRNTRELIRRVGRIATDRLELARYFYLSDRPEETWENANIADLYDKLFKNLELAERHRAMHDKLEGMEGSLEIVLDLWQVRRSHSLEWGIIFLIVFEIVLSLVKLV